MTARTPKWMLLVAAALVATGCGNASGTIRTIDWARTPPLSGQVVDGVVRVTAPVSGGTFPLAIVVHPRVPAEGYLLKGDLRHEDVQGRAFVQMWSEFADGERYFSRTVAEGGPQGSLSGSSDWRVFELPFFLEGDSRPQRLELGVVLPGAGTVEIGRLELVPLGNPSAAWWSDRAGGLVGGVVGSVIGIFGAVIGWLVARRRARVFVLGAMKVAAIMGVVFIGIGAVAIAMSQPYGVAYPMLLTGVILAVVFGGLLPNARRTYADDELRRMRALDRV